MTSMLARNWGWVLLRGVAALVFGLLTFVNPGITLVVLVMFFAAYAFVDGIFTIIWAIANRRGEPHWVALLVAGIAGVIIGEVTFAMPGITAIVLLYLIAAWALITGIMEIIAAVRLRKVIQGEWVLVLAGVLSVLFGLLLFVAPGAGALALLLWIGIYAVLTGILLIVFAVRLRSWLKGAEAAA